MTQQPIQPANSAVQKAKEAALEKKQPVTIQEMIEKSAKALGNALPAHMRPERMVRIALTTLRLNPKLYTCDPQSFLGALFQCAQLGLEPNIEGQAYIIPYNTSVKTPTGWEKKMVAQFQIGYKGFVELFWRHQSSVSLTMETIHKNDHFMCDLGSNELGHRLPPFGEERGDVVGYYALAKLKNGGVSFKVMSKEEATIFAKKFTKCWDAKNKAFMEGTPWADHFDAMAMKTVLKQLMKVLPKSIEIQRALAMDETVKFNVDRDMVEVPAAEIEHTAEKLPSLAESVGPGASTGREPGSEG